YTLYWDSWSVNKTFNCVAKVGRGGPCSSSYECQDYNYLSCISGTCGCTQYQYYDNVSSCEPKLNYSYPCAGTYQCRNWTSGPNLQCIFGGSVYQCLCLSSQYYDYCLDMCVAVKGWQVACTTSSCYPSSQCDLTKSLSCVSGLW
ncbi:unnamed protein product, partial [Didymodactylos carnosus]